MTAEPKNGVGKYGGPQRDPATGLFRSACTPEMIEKICEVMKTGVGVETAAIYVGLSKVTIYDWLARGKDGDPTCTPLLEAMELSLAKNEVRDATIITDAGTKFWQAAAWRLERRFPQRWARKTEFHGTVELPLVLTPAQRAAIAEARAKGQALVAAEAAAGIIDVAHEDK